MIWIIRYFIVAFVVAVAAGVVQIRDGSYDEEEPYINGLVSICAGPLWPIVIVLAVLYGICMGIMFIAKKVNDCLEAKDAGHTERKDT